MKSVMTMSFVALAVMISQAPAGNHHNRCNQCGCGVKKVCRLKCEMKDVTTYRYESKCEDFCLPGPSKCCGSKWVCDCESLCGRHKEHMWQPRCGHMCHRKVLVKIPVTKKVPAYTCEVVCLCGSCGCAQVDEEATAEARARQIMPVSAEEPLVLEDHTQESQADDQAPAADAAPVKQASFLGRIFR
ncbi:MAG TPA: hypothetical protein VHV55_18145 [Pirellulales bacterium]|jgi:hypothetical protein|nr:hypothetical protein [Pirellulales bacterium]